MSVASPSRCGCRAIANYQRATDDDTYDTPVAGPVERMPRGYSLGVIRCNGYLRGRIRRIDLDTVTFDFGAWRVLPDQYNQLVARRYGMRRYAIGDPMRFF
jgi:hypothetical protein